jgi:hypothetical protein
MAEVESVSYGSLPNKRRLCHSSNITLNSGDQLADLIECMNLQLVLSRVPTGVVANWESRGGPP